MKKFILVLVLVAMVGAGAFALDISVGGGAMLDYSFNNGLKYDPIDYYIGTRHMSIAALAFFDFTYLEVDISIGYGSLSWKEELLSYSDTWSDGDGMIELGISLLLKYPIVMNRMVFFPFAGINYNAVLSWWDDYADSYDNNSDLNQFGILVGIGFDNYINDNLYFRVEAGVNFRFASKLQDDLNKYLSGGDLDTTIGIGPRVKLGIGTYF